MNISSKHAQFSVLAGLVTVFGLTIGFAGAEGASLPAIASSFVLTTSNGITDGAFADAKFDIAGYMSHPCFQISGTEVDNCAYQYGITEPLKTYLDNGMLLSWVNASGLMAAGTPMITTVTGSIVTATGSTMTTAATTTGSTVTTTTATGAITTGTEPMGTKTMTMEPEVTVLTDTTTSEEDFSQLLLARSNKLWNICIREDASREMASLCYQQNIRLLMRLDTDLNEDTVQ